MNKLISTKYCTVNYIDIRFSIFRRGTEMSNISNYQITVYIHVQLVIQNVVRINIKFN